MKKQPKLEVNDLELIDIEIKGNTLIKQHRKRLDLKTPTNRLDQGDVRCILYAMNELGFSITRAKMEVYNLEQAMNFFLNNSQGNVICVKGENRKEVGNYEDAKDFFSNN